MILISGTGRRVWAAVAAAVLAGSAAARADLSTAARVVAYDPGTLSGTYADQSAGATAGAGLGPPATTEGGYFGDNSVVTPFNAQYNPADYVGLQGSGGSIEFKLSTPIGTNGFTLGIQAGINLYDQSGGGTTGPQASDLGTPRQATVLVSSDGVNFVSLGDHTFTNPSNAYTDITQPTPKTPGTSPADFSKPFTGTLSSFNGEDLQQVLATLNGSGGGDWFDLSGTGLASVDYVELETSADETDYVNAITGVSATPEPTSAALLGVGVASLLGRRRRRFPV